MRRSLAQSLKHKESETTHKGFERAQEILDAAQAIFASEGYANLSLRAVAARAGVTLGSLQHYYKTKDALMEAMLLSSFERYQAEIDRLIAAMPDAPRLAQFRRAMQFFIGTTCSPLTHGMLFELAALATRHAVAAQVMDRMYARARRTIRRLIEPLVPGGSKEEIDRRAALILAQLNGLSTQIGGGRPRPTGLEGFEEATVEVMVATATAPIR